jgi:methyl-accepting chemotaxis protein
MDRIQEMLQDETVTRDRDMQRDMDRMRQHFDSVSKNLEETVTTMERIQDRLQASASALQ